MNETELRSMIASGRDWNKDSYSTKLSLGEIPQGLVSEIKEKYPEISFELFGKPFDTDKVYFSPLFEYTEVVYEDDCCGVRLRPEDFEVEVIQNGAAYEHFEVVLSQDYHRVYEVSRKGLRLGATEKSIVFAMPDDRKDGLNEYEITRQIKDTTKIFDNRDGDYSLPSLVVEVPYHVTCTSSTSKDGEDFTTITWTTHANTLEEAEKEINDWLIENDIK